MSGNTAYDRREGYALISRPVFADDEPLLSLKRKPSRMPNREHDGEGDNGDERIRVLPPRVLAATQNETDNRIVKLS